LYPPDVTIVPPVAANGIIGVTLLDAADAAEVPLLLLAVTVNVYAVPPVRPETVIGLVDEVPVNPPGLEVAVKLVIVEPPVAFAVNGTDAVVDVGDDAVPIVGACGTVVAVMLDVAAEAADVAVVFVALTVNVYDVADCNPVTVIGEDPVAVNPPGEDVTVNVAAVPPVGAAV
jgi:hypothetical protein